MTRTRRIAATLVASLALVAPVGTAAHAGGPDATKTVKAQTKQLLKDIAGKDKRLTRLVTSHAVTALADDTEAGVVLNITGAQAALAEIKTSAEAADSTVDTRAVRKELRSFRVENFRLVVNVLRQVEELTADAAADAEAQALLDQAETTALAVTATSTKSALKDLRTLLADARAELEETEPVVTTVV